MIEKSRKSPEFFFKSVLHLPTFEYQGKQLTHWQKQIDIANHVRDFEETFVKSGHGAGKTYLSASIALWFLFSFENSLVITTAPTQRQTKEILWAEISRQYNPDILGGELTTLKLEIDENWKALGFTARESVDQEKMAARMQGFHAPHVLVIFDEAAGVHPAFWVAKEGAMSGSHVRFLAIANPTSPSGEFYQGCLKHKAITISCYEHPNVISGQEIIPGAVTKKWIEKRRDEWGEDSPLYISRVLGEFPDEGEDTLIPLSKCTEAVNREPFKEKLQDIKALGVDVARFGSDSTVLYSKFGRNEHKKAKYHGKDTIWTVSKIKEWDAEFKYDVILIDDTGVGGGVTDALKDYERKDGKSPQIIPVNNAESPVGFFDSVEFENIKAELFWLLRIDFQNKNIKINDEGTLVAELASLKYDYTTKQKIKIISKDEMRKKGLKSPDEADALCLANYGTHVYRQTLPDKISGEKTPGIVGNIMKEKY